MFFDVINKTKWDELMADESLFTKYQTAEPFPHIVIDGLFEFMHLHAAYLGFPKPDEAWWKYDNFMEKKWAKDDLTDVCDPIQTIVATLNGKKFVSFLEKLTGIQGLVVDCQLNGGGLHQITEGGKLDIHIDYNYHPVTKLDRRLNVLLYLNHDWQQEWGGELELWDSDVQKRAVAISPLFNRLVVFSTTEKSNHGHPEPLRCPPNRTRKSIATYLYTNGRPENEKAEPHSTIFKRRPCDPDDPEAERLRAIRSRRRLN